jgi:hypothetical protein
MSVIRIEIEVPDQDNAYDMASTIPERLALRNDVRVTGFALHVDTDTKAQIRRTALAWASLVLKEDL